MELVMWIPIDILIPDRFTISEIATTFFSFARSVQEEGKISGTSANAVCVAQVNAPASKSVAGNRTLSYEITFASDGMAYVVHCIARIRIDRVDQRDSSREESHCR
ncbi:hypothetical protein V6N11_064110 [Hibiscus sabdariffa]|uniref:Uncharacterized protein n=1 Tax=Hibiscus sabdariffa TaxID=183260 RepID=A0ABR2PMM7_9ROSI